MRLFQRALFTALTTALAMATPSVVFAQAGTIGSYSRPQTNPNPAFSPYLNLNRGGSSAAINYFGIVRPQVEANRNFQMIEQGNFGPQGSGMPGGAAMIGPDGRPLGQPGVGAQDPTALLQTGHPATYFYYSHYFPMGPGGRAGGAGGAGSGPGALNTANFGRPANTATPFLFGSGGALIPVNPSGANPIGGGLGSMPTVPGQLAPSLLP